MVVLFLVCADQAARILAKATDKKEPITAEILKFLVAKYGGEDVNLGDIHTLAICDCPCE